MHLPIEGREREREGSVLPVGGDVIINFLDADDADDADFFLLPQSFRHAELVSASVY